MRYMQHTLGVALGLAIAAPIALCRAQQFPTHLPPPPPLTTTRDSVTQAGAATLDGGPSRETTMEFLASFLRTRMEDRGLAAVRDVEADECTLRILYAKGTDRMLALDLADVDPGTIRESGARQVSLQTTNAQPKITWEVIDWLGSTPHQTNRVERWSSLDIRMKTHEDQQRLLRALRHGVHVCGGQAAPF